jgi:hypothetical protein
MSGSGEFAEAREVSAPIRHALEYSVCTIVNDRSQYQAMLTSFRNAGFTESTSEFLYIDNVDANRLDAFQSVNQLIAQSVGKYIVLCHQDVRLLTDGLDVLTDCLKSVNAASELQIGMALISTMVLCRRRSSALMKILLSSNNQPFWACRPIWVATICMAPISACWRACAD